MINNYKEMSTRYLKHNKKRTVLTLLGIILSLSLIATIGLFVKSGEKSQIESVKQMTGSTFHLGYKTYTDEILSKVSNNPNVERYGIMSSDERIPYGDITLEKHYMNKGATELFKYMIKEGRMPENNSEIAVDEWAKDNIKAGLKIGDAIEVEGKALIVVGFLKNDESYQREKNCKGITFSDAPENGQLFLEIGEKADFDESIKTLSSLTKKENLIKNDELVRLRSFGSNKSLIVAAGIGVVIVLSATIIVIYNSFQINVAERVKQFGLLRSIGATKKQIKKIVFREATILLMIAIPIGILISIGAIYGINFVFKLLLKGDNPISLVTIDPFVLLASCGITIVGVYISSFIPARFVGSISPLVAVSSRATIKKDRIKRRKYPLLKKIFNYKIVMAIKNITRNPARCQTMILSIVVSSALFITFTSFMEEVFTVKRPGGAYEIIDLSIQRNSGFGDFTEINNNDEFNKISDKVNSLGNVERIYKQYNSLMGYIEVPNDKKVKEASNIYKKQRVGDEYKKVIDSEIKTYDKSALLEIEKHLIGGALDLNTMATENGVILVQNGRARDNTTHKLYMGKLTEYKVNDEIVINADGKDLKVKIVGIIKDEIFEREESTNVLNLITSEQVMKNLTGKEPQVKDMSINLKDKSLDLKTAGEVNNILNAYPSFSLVNFVDINENQRNSMIMIQVLVYGFIGVIALISSINIINTITMNITLRRKESAMLKSIGMSQKDLKNMIIYEGLFYGVFGGVLGSLIGCGLSYTLYNVISDIVGMQWKAPIGLSVITILIAITISYLSTLIPLRKIEKDNVIEAIREE
ncbi:MAG: ABC transporter permease [Clostridium sp.]